MKRIFSIIILVFTLSVLASAQTTAFNFQGRLNDGNAPANGKYDLQFRLYDAAAGGNQVGATVSKPNLTLINGVFSTQLDFGLAAFTGADRFIEISLRSTATGSTTPNAYVILGPRQQILSVPYTIRSLRATLADDANHAVNADNAIYADNALDSQSLGGYAASQYVKRSSNGNVGIDIDSPPDKLTVKTATNSYGVIQTDGSVQVGTAVGIAGSGELVGGYGTKSNHTLRLFTNNNPNGGMTLDVKSNLRQPSNAYGLVKAMAEVDIDGRILKCYNSSLISDSATIAPCGISINHFTNGGYGMDFGFPVNFVSATITRGQYFSPITDNGMIRYERGTGNNINIRTAKPGDNQTTSDYGFMVIIF